LSGAGDKSARAPLSIAIGRFARLPQRSNELWQGDLVSLPVWIGDENDPDVPPTRPRAAVWVSRRTGLVHVTELEERHEATAEDALRALLAFAVDEARQLEGRPATIEVRDRSLRDALADVLTGLTTTVALVDALPLVQDALRNEEIEEYGDPLPNLLDVPGMTVERLRAFADAASRFFQSQPWARFPDDELIVVEAPSSPRGLQHVIVTGSDSPPLGLTGFTSRGEFERLLDLDRDDAAADEEAALRRAHSVTFGTIDTLPFGDADAWLEHGLPLAHSRAYPFAAELDADEGMRRPTPRELAHLEALLRMLAASDDDEIDRGRWQQTVETADGPVTMTLVLPALLEATGGPLRTTLPVGPAAALARAQQLMDDSRDAGGRLPITRARQAIALSEDCVDAWLTLLDVATTDEQALDLSQRAVAAAARVIGAARFEALTGRFGAAADTRAYLEARIAVAQCFRDVRRVDETIEAYREVVRLDADDRYGARYPLVAQLLQAQRDDDAIALLDAYADDPDASFAYARALVMFRRDGDALPARDALAEAVRANRHAALFLADPESVPDEPAESVAPGSKDEAAQIWFVLARPYATTPGAVEWLRGRTPPPARQRRGGGRRRR
jgi:tetratricopeptide (TPR) repeat protein